MYHFFLNLIGILFKNILIYLGPIYIKLGQLLSYDYPIFKNLQTLQNKCPELNSKEINYFQNKYPNLNISDQCFAAGSVSVVHIPLPARATAELSSIFRLTRMAISRTSASRSTRSGIQRSSSRASMRTMSLWASSTMTLCTGNGEGRHVLSHP